MAVGNGPAGQLVLRMAEPPPSGCSGGNGDGDSGPRALAVPAPGCSHHTCVAMLAPPSCQVGSGALAEAQRSASSLHTSTCSVTGTVGEVED